MPSEADPRFLERPQPVSHSVLFVDETIIQSGSVTMIVKAKIVKSILLISKCDVQIKCSTLSDSIFLLVQSL